MLSLPLAFATRMETIPSTIPYLRADPVKATRWRERLDREIGAARGAGPVAAPRAKGRSGLGGWVRAAAGCSPARSVALDAPEPVRAAGGNARRSFHLIAEGRPGNTGANTPEGMSLLDWTDELHDFADTAALVECLDLVISVDTAVAHLAGGLASRSGC